MSWYKPLPASRKTTQRNFFNDRSAKAFRVLDLLIAKEMAMRITSAPLLGAHLASCFTNQELMTKHTDSGAKLAILNLSSNS